MSDCEYIRFKEAKYDKAQKKDRSLYSVSKRVCLEHYSSKRRQNLVAVVFDKKGNFISCGYNSYEKTHPLQKKFGVNIFKEFMHAEIEALVKGLRNTQLEGCTVCIVRLSKQLEDKLGFPCDGCYEALKTFKLKKVIFHNGSCVCSHIIV